MDLPAFPGVDPGGIDAAVTQNVRKADDVLLHGIEHLGEQMAQIVGKYFFRLHPGFFTELLHLPPELLEN